MLKMELWEIEAVEERMWGVGGDIKIHTYGPGRGLFLSRTCLLISSDVRWADDKPVGWGIKFIPNPSYDIEEYEVEVIRARCNPKLKTLWLRISELRTVREHYVPMPPSRRQMNV
jgi:hypothetical protein